MKVHSIAGANDLTLHVEEAGNPEGKPLLFIHGFSQCRLSWARQMGSDLARDFRLIAIDIRGHGLSGKPRDQYGDPKLWAQDINAVIGTLGLSNPILIGWSYGGVIISDYLAMYGDSAIGGSVWVGAVSRLGAPLVEGGFLGAGFLDLIPGFFSEDVVDSTDTLQRFLRLCVHEVPSPQDFYFFLGFNSLVPPYVRQGLFARELNNDAVIAKTRKPMLLVHGETDQIVSPRMCAHLQKLVPEAKVSTYANVGHMPFWEASDRFNRELRAFRERIQ